MKLTSKLLACAMICALASCGPKPLKVLPAQPLPRPKVAVPDFLKACPPLPPSIADQCK